VGFEKAYKAAMKLLTAKEAADRLGVHRSRVHVLIQDGRLPAERFGRAYMIKESDLKLVRNRKPGRPKKKRSKG
jgi:excisionase family DNA binding protein